MDLFLDGYAARRLDFGCIVFDQTKVDHRRFNQGDKDKGFFKFLYQHYNKHRRSFGDVSTYRCFHGNRDTAYDLKEMRSILNSAATGSVGFPISPYLMVEFAEVRRTNLLQMTDLLIGCVGHAMNGRGVGRPNAPKTRLSEHLRREGPADFLTKETELPDRGFSIWHFELG